MQTDNYLKKLMAGVESVAHLTLFPFVKGHTANERDVSPQATVNARALHADEDAKLGRGPARS